MPKAILVVEDEEDLQELLAYNLHSDGFVTTPAMTGEDALRHAARGKTDLILLDLMLPSIDGLEVCRRLKQEEATRDIPIIMLTAKGEDADIVCGLELGADDYVTKPFSMRVLISRIKSVLRRSTAAASPEGTRLIKAGELAMDTARHEVRLGNRVVDLTSTEFQVLHALASRPGWVLTRAQLIEAVHGDGYPVTDRAVDVQMVGLRKKLGKAGDMIETVRGVGYRLKG